MLLSAEALTAAGIIKDISFALHSGEVLGIFGLMGSGRTELARILFGLDGHDSGDDRRRRPAGSTIHRRARSIRNGIAFVTENRREEGLLMNGAIADNITLAALPKFAVDAGRIHRAARGLREAAAEVGGGAQHQGGLAATAGKEPVRAATSRRSCSPSG